MKINLILFSFRLLTERRGPVVNTPVSSHHLQFIIHVSSFYFTLYSLRN
jgi:hypothetical protein